MASFDFETDLEVAKMMRASSRATNLHIKRSELTRPRGARDWTWGKGIEAAKPHRCARAAARTCLARGAVEAQEDMPSIVGMSSAGKAPRRKPAVAHHAKLQEAWDNAANIDEDSTTADEGSDGEELETPQSPAFGPQEAPQQLESELGTWPALPQTASSSSAATPAAEEEQPAGDAKLSHREVALRFAVERRHEQAALDRRRAKKAKAARTVHEANAWKTSFRRRRQKLQMAKRTQQQVEVKACAGMAPARQEEESLASATASLDSEMDRDVLKMMRAASRAEKLRVKRSELTRARGARDWTWGKGIEAAKPHRCARAAARTCLARGAVEAQEDMPSIVGMSSAGKAPRRKPAIATLLTNVTFQDACHEASGAVAESQQPGKVAKESAQGPPASGPQAAPQQVESVLGAWVALPQTSGVEPAEPAEKKGAGCTIS